MRFIMIMLAFACNSARGDVWTPPENPDPQAILLEAHADTLAKRYETALAKHVWFHENALWINRSLYGVRLSFALSYWDELAKEYPPALTKLKEIRDQAVDRVTEGKDVAESFHVMVAINRKLHEDLLTKDIFEALDEKNPKAAKQVFDDVAKSSLLRAKAYSVLGKYVDAKSDFARMRETYRQEKRLADDPRLGVHRLEFANKKFANDAMTLVAILAVNDRNEEAEGIAASARAEWDDSEFNAGLKKALQGVVPDPWPSYEVPNNRVSRSGGSRGKWSEHQPPRPR